MTALHLRLLPNAEAHPDLLPLSWRRWWRRWRRRRRWWRRRWRRRWIRWRRWIRRRRWIRWRRWRWGRCREHRVAPLFGHGQADHDRQGDSGERGYQIAPRDGRTGTSRRNQLLLLQFENCILRQGFGYTRTQRFPHGSRHFGKRSGAAARIPGCAGGRIQGKDSLMIGIDEDSRTVGKPVLGHGVQACTFNWHVDLVSIG